MATLERHRLITLGGLQLDGRGPDAGPLAGQKKRLALLAVLARAMPGGVSRDRLLALLWPESPEDRARNALAQALYTLRRALGDNAIPSTGQIGLNPDVLSSDAAEFMDRLAAGDLAGAVGLYGGPFLDGFHIRDAPEFERWCDEERSRLAASYHRALEQLGEAAAQSGDHREAARWWKQRATGEPLSARIARAYVEQLALSGDGAAAIRHAETWGALVRAELDMDPDPAVLDAARSTPGPRTRPPFVAWTSAPQGGTAETPVHFGPVAGRPRAMTGRRPLLWVATAAVVLAFVVAAGVLLARPERSSAVLVVVPLENDTGDSTASTFTRIAADWLSQSLSRASIAEVVDFREALKDVDAHAAPSTIGARVAATYVVTGTLYAKADSLRVMARIIRVRDGVIVHELDGLSAPASDPTRLLDPLQQRVVGAVASVLDVRLRSFLPNVVQPPRFDAYQEFMRGLERMSHTPASGAFAHFLRAAQLDTSFVQAKILAVELFDGTVPDALVDSLLEVASRQRDHLTPFDQASLDRTLAFEAGDLPKVYEAARRMYTIAPHSHGAGIAYAHAAIATNRYDQAVRILHGIDIARGAANDIVMFWKWEAMAHHRAGDLRGALAEWRRARERFPQRADVCMAGMTPLGALGDLNGGLALMAECAALPGAPLDSILGFLALGSEMRTHGHHESARRAFELGLAAAAARPQRPRAPSWFHYEMGRWSEALALLRAHVRDTLDLDNRGMIALAAAGVGDTATVRATEAWLTAQRTLGRTAPDRAQHDLWRAKLLAARGQVDSAMTLIVAAVDSGLAPAFFLHNDKGLEPLAAHPRFRASTAPRRSGLR